MNDIKCLLRGIMLYLLIDFISLSMDKSSGILLILFDVELWILIVVKGIIYASILVVILLLLKRLINNRIELKDKNIIGLLVLFYILQNVTSYIYNNIFHTVGKNAILLSNIFSAEQAIYFIFNLFLIIILLFYFLKKMNSDTVFDLPKS